MHHHWLQLTSMRAQFIGIHFIIYSNFQFILVQLNSELAASVIISLGEFPHSEKTHKLLMSIQQSVIRENSIAVFHPLGKISFLVVL